MSILSTKDLIQYEDEGYLIIREAFAPERVKALRMAVIAMIDRGLEGECELKWIDRDKRLRRGPAICCTPTNTTRSGPNG